MADRFVFRAQVVLDIRRRRDEEAQRALAAANGALQRAQEALEAAGEQVRLACLRPREAGVAFEWYRNWMVGLRDAVARRAEEVQQRRREQEAAVTQAMRVRRDLRVIERLRDRRRRAFELDLVRREQRQIDELAIQQHVAPARPSGGGLS